MDHKIFTQNDKFILNGKRKQEGFDTFCSWAYSQMENNLVRSVLAEYIVAMALGLPDIEDEKYRQTLRPFDLKYKGKKIEVKSASTVQMSGEAKSKTNYTFRIAPARKPDDKGDYKDDAPLQRNNDLYVFAIFEPETKEKNPLNLDNWNFIIVATKVLNEKDPSAKTIGINPLKQLEHKECKFQQLSETIDSIINDIK